MQKTLFESETRTFPSAESDSWLASRPFISVEAIIGVDRSPSERVGRDNVLRGCEHDTNESDAVTSFRR